MESEFERAKKRREKRQEQVARSAANRAEPVVPKKPDVCSIFIRDNEREYTFHFTVENIGNHRLASQRGGDAYKELVSGFVTKEFGRWRFNPTP